MGRMLGRLADQPRQRNKRGGRHHEQREVVGVADEVDDHGDRREAERCPQEPARHGPLAYPRPPCQDLRSGEAGPHNPVWSNVAPRHRSCRFVPRTRSSAALRSSLRQDRLPGRLHRSRVPFVYAYEEFGHTYIGCMQKVYDVEIDIDLLREASGGAAASARSARSGSRCRCAASRSRRPITSAATSSAASTPSFPSCRSAARRSGFRPGPLVASRPAGMQLAHLRHLRLVRAMVVRAGHPSTAGRPEASGGRGRRRASRPSGPRGRSRGGRGSNERRLRVVDVQRA